eukprot:gene1060-174_t
MSAKLRLSHFYGKLVAFSGDDEQKRFELSNLSEKDKNTVEQICQTLELKVKPYKKGKTLVITRDFGSGAESSTDSEAERHIRKQQEAAAMADHGPSMPGKGKGKGGDEVAVNEPPKKKKRLRLTDLDNEGNAGHYRMKARDLIDTLTNKMKSLARMESEVLVQQRLNKGLKAAQVHLGVPNEEDIGSSGGEWKDSEGEELAEDSSDEQMDGSDGS